MAPNSIKEFPKQNPREFKIVVIDNAGFHSCQNIDIPENIFLLRIPPYRPELNPCEQIRQQIKQRFKNITLLKNWLHQIVSIWIMN